MNNLLRNYLISSFLVVYSSSRRVYVWTVPFNLRAVGGQAERQVQEEERKKREQEAEQARRHHINRLSIFKP